MSKKYARVVKGVIAILVVIAIGIALDYSNQQILRFDHPSDEELIEFFEANREMFEEISSLVQELKADACQTDNAVCQEKRDQLAMITDEAEELLLYSLEVTNKENAFHPEGVLIRISQDDIQANSRISDKGFAYLVEPVATCRYCAEVDDLDRFDSARTRRPAPTFGFRQIEADWYLYWTSRLGQM